MLRAWRLIASAPLNTAIDVAVIGRDGLHLLAVPVLRTDDGWVNAETGLSSTSGRHIGDHGGEARKSLNIPAG
jgi:hypothetical protein